MATRAHLFVCTNTRPEGGRPACGSRGGEALIEALTSAIFHRGAAARIAVTPCGCLGPCFDGPNAVEYPAGRWWSRLGPEDAEALAAVLDGHTPVAPALTEKLLDRE
jgi:(2Fe-2S) ferredoxin